MDTLTHSHQVEEPGRKHRWRTKAERRAIVEETLVPGASVSRVARRYDVNANQVFHWRKLYHEGRLGRTTNFLPVRVADEQRGSVALVGAAALDAGTFVGSGIRTKDRAVTANRSAHSRGASVSYWCPVNGAKSRENANKKRKEKENLTNPI